MSTDKTEALTEDAPASGSELASLKLQRSHMKRNITNLHKKVERDGDKVDPTILECRLEILESYFKQLCFIQGQIEKLNSTDSSRSELEDIFISAKAKLRMLLNKSRGSTSMDHSFFNASIAGGSNPARLPSLKLPRFDGKYADYTRFISTFNSMFHENSSITAVDKFSYMMSCLLDPTLLVVEPYTITK